MSAPVNAGPRIVMVASGVWLALAGIACLFAPAETGAALGGDGIDALFVELLGALFIASAAANWTARGSMIGGIYARPLSVGNFFHFVIGATVLSKKISAENFSLLYVLVTMVYLVFAIAFALLLFGYFGRKEGSK
jgi:hypothetical protein